MKTQLLLHCGGKVATLDELKAAPLPEETETYKPVGHYDLVENVERVADQLLSDYQFHKGMYALSNNGQRLFGVHVYQSDVPDMGLSIGFRNSYDRSMSVGIAIGSTVLICDNLAFAGDITILRKHTVNVIEDLEIAILRVIYKSRTNFIQLVKSAQRMKAELLSDDDAFKLLGLLFGRKILTPRQLPVAKHEWLTPSYEEFQPKTYWSFYNAATAALKSSPPNRILERHIQLHDCLTETLDAS